MKLGEADGPKCVKDKVVGDCIRGGGRPACLALCNLVTLRMSQVASNGDGTLCLSRHWRAGADGFDDAVEIGVGRGGAREEISTTIDWVFGDVSANGATFVLRFAGIGFLAFD